MNALSRKDPAMLRCTCFGLLVLALVSPLPAEDAAKSDEGYVSLFDGKTLTGWQGDVKGYSVADGAIVCQEKGGGFLYTDKEYADFSLRIEFKLTPGANNGIGLRVPLNKSDPAYAGMEIQVLDDTSDKYKSIKDYQHHGSVYGIVPAKTGHLKPVGEWNSEEITLRGKLITVVLNGETIVSADLAQASTPKTIDGREHPGLARDKGHICFCGHGAHVEFRNVRVKELK